MARTLNEVRLIGNLAMDPVVRPTNNGSIVANIRVATHRQYKDKSGEVVRETEFTPVVCYDKLAESVRDYLTKGRSVFVSGRLHTDKWEDKNTGDPRSQMEVVADEVIFLDNRNSGRVTGDNTNQDEEQLVGASNGTAPYIAEIKL